MPTRPWSTAEIALMPPRLNQLLPEKWKLIGKVETASTFCWKETAWEWWVSKAETFACFAAIHVQLSTSTAKKWSGSTDGCGEATRCHCHWSYGQETEHDCKTCAKSIPSLPFKHQPPRQHEELLGGANQHDSKSSPMSKFVRIRSMQKDKAIETMYPSTLSLTNVLCCSIKNARTPRDCQVQVHDKVPLNPLPASLQQMSSLS